jgi:selenide,water dikinase
MVSGSGVGVRIDSEAVPLIDEALGFAAMGLIPAAAYRNKEFRQEMIAVGEKVPRALEDILFDPQTSGGLLIGVRGDQADELVTALKDADVGEAALIGEVAAGGPEKIWVG